MGTNHARVARQLRGAELVAVVDANVERAVTAARPSGAHAASSIDEIVGTIDLAVVALPTRFHLEAVEQLAAAGIHLLVEKPIAGTVAEARRLIELCNEHRVNLSVGHVERFNAAVAALPTFLDAPLHIEASRISPYSARIPDGVIFDLMIHDLDIVCWLAGDDATVVDVSGVARAVRGDTEDIATATITFSSGLTAAFNTSRLGQQKTRLIEITQTESVITADLVRQDLTIHRMSHHEYLTDEGTRYRQSSVVEIPFIENRGEPLLRELQHFVDAVHEGGVPAVTGAHGLRALELADAISSAVRRS